MAFDPFILQRTIDPKSIEACLLNDDEREDLPRPHPRFLPKLHKALQQPSDVATAHHVLRHFLSAGWRQRRDQPSRSTEFQ